jgi:hypothetical protein
MEKLHFMEEVRKVLKNVSLRSRSNRTLEKNQRREIHHLHTSMDIIRVRVTGHAVRVV